MQIVIELSETDFEDIKKHSGSYSFGEAIKNGVVLPRYYGRLIDADALIFNADYYEPLISKRDFDLAPTVIEADVTDINVGEIEGEEDRNDRDKY